MVSSRSSSGARPFGRGIRPVRRVSAPRRSGTRPPSCLGSTGHRPTRRTSAVSTSPGASGRAFRGRGGRCRHPRRRPSGLRTPFCRHGPTGGDGVGPLPSSGLPVTGGTGTATHTPVVPSTTRDSTGNDDSSKGGSTVGCPSSPGRCVIPPFLFFSFSSLCPLSHSPVLCLFLCTLSSSVFLLSH